MSCNVCMYVCQEHVSGDIEALTVRTIGVKNCDVHRALADVALPAEVSQNLKNASRNCMYVCMYGEDSVRDINCMHACVWYVVCMCSWLYV